MDLKRHKDFINESQESNPNVEIGDRVEMIQMKDEHSPIEPGSKGTVVHIDGIGQLHIDGIGQLHFDWDNGRTLAIIPEEDSFKIIN